MTRNAVVVDGLCKRYDRRAVALDGVTFEVPRGEFVVIVGPSGCGKSTLLNLIAGIETPTAGRVVVAGRNLSDLTDDERTDLRLRYTGFVFQNFNLLPTFTVAENVALPLELLGTPARSARAHAADLLDQVGVALRAHCRRPAELSGGEQQRVAIARALITQPELLLADEPTGNLDSRTGQATLDLLSLLNESKEVTVVMVTHDTHAAMIGHRIIELRDGQVVRDVGGVSQAGCPDDPFPASDAAPDSLLGLRARMAP